jgi:mannose-6-phosphate isomerase-like protein (cupin superfamily)
VRIVELAVGPGHSIDRFGSVGAHHLGGVRFSGGGGWTFIALDAGGNLGRHPTMLMQLFVVVEGSGWVAGGDGERTPITSGQAALWEAGEEHESGTDGGMRVAVLEATAIEVP